MDFADIFAFLKARLAQGQACVLVTVCAVEGSSMRNPGTLMGVARDGAFTGSLSGGCIENAVVAEALDALDHGAARIVRFGAGSPYLDIKLPCGGGLDVHFQPLNADTLDADRLETDRGVVDAALASIARRAPFALAHDGTQLRHVDAWRPSSPLAQGERWSFGYWPAPRLQIVGHGAGVEALARLALETGCAVSVLTPDPALLADLEARAIPAQRLA
ncbi:MAG: XdhC family protein, partial [Pseudomonadota bacterium]